MRDSVKLVFLTDGEASPESCGKWLNRPVTELSPRDYTLFALKRREEALAAAGRLGLGQRDLIFLAYPDGGLGKIVKGKKCFRSGFTLRDRAQKSESQGLSANGYCFDNLLSDIEKIVREYRPGIIYLPHPADFHDDHAASAQIITAVLSRLERKRGFKKSEVRYYLVHSACPKCAEEIPAYERLEERLTEEEKNIKSQALEAYESQLRLPRQGCFLRGFVREREFFYMRPRPRDPLRKYEEEWFNVASRLKESGYDVNMAPVLDIVDDNANSGNGLMKKQRIFSSDPMIVFNLGEAAVKAMNRARVIPVLKHFPGLGRSLMDTHFGLEAIPSTREELKRDIAPFKKMIDAGAGFWVMTSHAVYPGLDEEGIPATFSRKILKDILRDKLGYKGVIITDELSCMQSVGQYLGGNKGEWTGEAVEKAFAAGADIALFYVSSPEEAEKVVKEIISRVRAAMAEGVISGEEFDKSVERILGEKKKVFGAGFFDKSLSPSDKICQKLSIDVYCDSRDKLEKWKGFFNDFPLGAVHLRNAEYAQEIRESSKVPILMLSLHEGGEVTQPGIQKGKSAFTIGQELGDSLKGTTRKKARTARAGTLGIKSRVSSPERREIKEALIAGVEEVIASFKELLVKGRIINPDYLSPLQFDRVAGISLRSFEESPFSWKNRFDCPEKSREAYLVLREAYLEFKKAEPRPYGNIRQAIAQLEQIKAKISFSGQKEKVRVLCVAAHPDDEDAEALVYLREKLGCETYILYATRGESGKNPPAVNDLGKTREKEAERSGAVLGAKEIFWLNREDFGYTESMEETFRHWEEKETLDKMLYVISIVKPHIVISKHNENEAHGHHKALVRLIRKAFDQCAVFSWKPRKLYLRALFGAGECPSISEIDNSLICGKKGSIQQISLKSIKKHRSQGDWSWLPGKSRIISYCLDKSRVGEKGFFTDGIKVDEN